MAQITKREGEKTIQSFTFVHFNKKIVSQFTVQPSTYSGYASTRMDTEPYSTKYYILKDARLKLFKQEPVKLLRRYTAIHRPFPGGCDIESAPIIIIIINE